MRNVKVEAMQRIMLHDHWWDSPFIFDSWSSIQYTAPAFQKPYRPNKIPLLYKKKPIKLTPVQEQMVALVAKKWDRYTDQQKETWLKSFRELSDPESPITDATQIDMSAIAEYVKKGPRYLVPSRSDYTIVDGKLRVSSLRPKYDFQKKENKKSLCIRVRLLARAQS